MAGSDGSDLEAADARAGCLHRHGFEESSVSLLEQIAARPLFRAGGHEDSPFVELLKTMDQHWTIVLVENVPTDVHDQIWANPNEILIERSMMQLTQR